MPAGLALPADFLALAPFLAAGLALPADFLALAPPFLAAGLALPADFLALAPLFLALAFLGADALAAARRLAAAALFEALRDALVSTQRWRPFLSDLRMYLRLSQPTCSPPRMTRPAAGAGALRPSLHATSVTWRWPVFLDLLADMATAMLWLLPPHPRTVARRALRLTACTAMSRSEARLDFAVQRRQLYECLSARLSERLMVRSGKYLRSSSRPTQLCLSSDLKAG